MLQLLGLILLVLGVFALIRGLRSRLLNTHPHCRGCGFDLQGLDLSEPNRCPECGRSVQTGARSVRTGKRKRRPLLAAAGCLVLMLGVAGLSWPKLSQIPSIQNINWYAHFPEPLLLHLESGGDKDALAELHSRLVPGELSDEGLQQLIDRSLALLDDESVPWDERWGDVLLYAFMLDKMSQTQMHRTIEQSYRPEPIIHDQIDLEMEEIAVWFNLGRITRGRWSAGFKMELARSLNPGATFPELPTPYQARVELFLPTEAGDEKPGMHTFIGVFDAAKEGWWYPLEAGGSGMGTTMSVPKSMQRFTARFDAEIAVYRNGEKFHAWTETIFKQVQRVEHPEYAEMVGRSPAIEDLIGAMSCSPMTVPTQIEEAMKHDAIRRSIPGVLSIRAETDMEIGMLGSVWLHNGNSQVKFGNLSAADLSTGGYTLMPPHQSEPDAGGWLKWFKEHEAFWEIALEKGSIDVVYQPDQSHASGDPRVSCALGVPIIFRDVGLVVEVPKLSEFREGGPDGPLKREWMMRPEREPQVGVSYTTSEYRRLFGRPEHVYGEPYDEQGAGTNP